ncbi:MAG: acyl-CoA dehydratase activase [Nitrospiraceae bacterium]|nr:acyl-CoA dehydratase activase [Nitrospiraceae bacterium]
MDKDLYLGIDMGSVSIKTALIDSAATLLADSYTRIKGDPLAALSGVLTKLAATCPDGRIISAGITGSGGKTVAGRIGAVFVNEILAQSAFAGTFHRGCRTIIEMGGEDAKLILLAPERNGGLRIEDFSMNAACAAGTGSFLDQQAHRLHLAIEEFSAIALKSKTPPAVAGRCSVFAKSDMIHLQQIATPDHDIVAGLCFGMARNFKATVGKGKAITPPVLFLGGVAANLGMRRAFREVLKLSENDLSIPGHFNTSGAIGAALTVRAQGVRDIAYRGAAALDRTGVNLRAGTAGRWTPLAAPAGIMRNPDHDRLAEKGTLIEAYLGVDVGSVSTNVVVIDREMRVLSKRYLPTAGRPIEAVKQGLAEVGAEVGHLVAIMGAATTGSGRYLTGDMIGADLVRNEITAQATAAAAIDPRVDTIFEIGGQDSKYISLAQGAVVDFEMNKACAAGTGSFLEEQAERLGIRIKGDFADRALCSSGPCRLGERCTVFMESDLVHYLNTGSGVPDLTAGLAYSIAQNYLNKVVAGKRVGERIFFQGGVAANKAVVSAFEQVTGKHVTVPPHHEVTGAIGAAILALRARNGKPSAFKGFDLSKRAYTVTTFQCAECANRCDIRRVVFEGEQPLFYGSRCEKYDVKRKAAEDRLPDLFGERDRILDQAMELPERTMGQVIGIPRMLYLADELPFWRAFFDELGFRTVLSDRTDRKVVNRGLESAAAETCFPAKVALGHVQDLIEKHVDILFLPSFVRLPALHGSGKFTQACPYGQALPYLAKAAFKFNGVRVIEAHLRLQDEKHFLASVRSVAKALGKSGRAVTKALERGRAAQQRAEDALKTRGKEVLAGLPKGVRSLVLVGRTYNSCDRQLNMNLPAKVRDLGVQVIPFDFLPLHDVDPEGFDTMYWRSGQKILAAGRYIKKHPDLFPVYITNFGCGPDSFISHFFRDEMAGKPFLQLEIDEHSADAGAVTRIEAYLDSIGNAGERAAKTRTVAEPRRSATKRRVLIPPMADHAHAIAAAFRACGVDAEVLPESDQESVKLGKEHSSGRECYPLALTTGDMIKATRQPGFDPATSAFFMPGGKGPCRFGQYSRYHRLVLDTLGLSDAVVLSPMQDESFYRDVGVVGGDFLRLNWQGIVAVDMLQKALWEHRPYEREQGASDGIYREALAAVCRAVEHRKDPLPALREAYRKFAGLGIGKRDRPVIGIVGEIYIRANRFGNENVVARIEQLGGEAWVAPIGEWLLYVNETAKVSARMSRSWKDLLKAYLSDWVQVRDEHRLLSGFNGSLRSLHEPSIATTLERARPYVHHSFEGEAVLSVGKAIDYAKRGVSGIVNVMPFSCMPGTITSGLLKRVAEDHNNIPLLTIAYEGQQDTQTVTRLEAFIHQARAYRESREGVGEASA